MPLTLPGVVPSAPIGSGITQRLGAGSYNGLSWGPGTKIHISAITGAADMPGIRAADTLRSYQHGHFRGVDLSAGRVIDITYVVIGDDADDFLDLIHALEKATVPQPDPANELPMLLYNNTRLYSVRPRKRVIHHDATILQRTGTVDVEYIASDPRVYDAALSTLTLAPGATGGGMTFPAFFPISFGPVSSAGVGTATNVGSFSTRPTVQIQGPCDGPVIENQTTGEYLEFTLTLGASDLLTLDLDVHSVILNGSASRRSSLVPGSRWWELAPGDTTVMYRADTVGTGSTATVSWRSAWL